MHQIRITCRRCGLKYWQSADREECFWCGAENLGESERDDELHGDYQMATDYTEDLPE